MSNITFNKRQLQQAVSHLERGRKLLEKPGVWIKGHFGRTRDGDTTAFLAEAVQVCSMGALGKIARKNGYAELPAAHFLACAIDPARLKGDIYSAANIIINFNDKKETAHKDMLKKWSAAEQKARRMLARARGKKSR